MKIKLKLRLRFHPHIPKAGDFKQNAMGYEMLDKNLMMKGQECMETSALLFFVCFSNSEESEFCCVSVSKSEDELTLRCLTYNFILREEKILPVEKKCFSSFFPFR